ncbi:ATP-binding protein [Clostridiaceae bacterium HSG29]|nr:ATP-binding protein [Clostridiaceae bacterium HSG29]
MKEICLKIEADKQYLEYIDDVLLQTLRLFNGDLACRFQFALHEIIINSIQAAEKDNGKTDNTITITLIKDDNEIRASVMDMFGGMKETKKDYNKISKEQILEENGRGIFFIKEIVDEYSWELDDNGSFTVHIVMNLDDKS